MRKPKTKAKPKKKVSKSFSGECELRQLPERSYFKVVKRDGTLSKSIYVKDKKSWNPFTRKYDVHNVNDIWSGGKEMKGSTKVSTRFTY